MRASNSFSIKAYDRRRKILGTLGNRGLDLTRHSWRANLSPQTSTRLICVLGGVYMSLLPSDFVTPEAWTSDEDNLKG